MSTPMVDQQPETSASQPKQSFRKRHPFIFWFWIAGPAIFMGFLLMLLVVFTTLFLMFGPDDAAFSGSGAPASPGNAISTPAPPTVAPTMELYLTTPQGRIKASDDLLRMGPLKRASELKANASEIEIHDWIEDVVWVHCNPENRFDRFELLAPNIITDPVPGNPVYDMLNNCATVGKVQTVQYKLNPNTATVRQYAWPLVQPDGSSVMATFHVEWKNSHWVITKIVR